MQTQLNAKQAAVTGGATSRTSTKLTDNRARLSDASGKVAVSAVTNTELGDSSGASSSIQTQINTKASHSTTTYAKTEVDGLLFQNYPTGSIASIQLMHTERKLRRLYCYDGIIGRLIFNPGGEYDQQIGLNIDNDDSSCINYYTKTQTYTKQEVDTQFPNLIQSVQAALNTFEKLTNALDNDANCVVTVQAQVNAKQATIAGGDTSITSTDSTVDRALLSVACKKVAVASATKTELRYVNGPTRSIQRQVDAKIGYDSNQSGPTS